MDNKLQYSQRIQTVCLLVLTALAISTALYFFSAVLIPFVLAVFLYYCLTPVIDVQMKKLRFPRFAAILTTILLSCLIMFVFGSIISCALNEIIRHTDEYQKQFEQLISQILSSSPTEIFGINISENVSTQKYISGETIKNILTGTINGIMSILSNGMLVLIFLIFMLIGKSKDSSSTPGVLREIEASIKRYTLAMIFTSSITGFTVGLTLSLLGIKFAWMFGFLAFLLNFIPNIGSIIATLLPIPVILLSSDMSLLVRFLAVAIPAAIQFVIGNIVQPKIMGRSLDLHPIAILMSLIFFGIIWGIIGMFLATPITAVLKILLEKFDYTRPVANVLAGRLGGGLGRNQKIV
ncbi:MAG: AI-2E family transporter [Sedimentisphaerales bacterium]|nr:AI-2E family transporter [Sedimentisphaerales bacterium]